MNYLSTIALILAFQIGVAPILSAEQNVVSGRYENGDQGEPIIFTGFRSAGKLTKIEVLPSVSSHALKCTALYNNQGDLILFTVEMWDLFDSQAINRLEEPKFNSIHLYQFKDGKMVYRNTEGENMYMPVKNIQSFMADLKKAAEKKFESVNQK